MKVNEMEMEWDRENQEWVVVASDEGCDDEGSEIRDRD